MFYKTYNEASHQNSDWLGTDCYTVNRNTGGFASQNSNKDRFAIGLLIGTFDAGGAGGGGMIGVLENFGSGRCLTPGVTLAIAALPYRPLRRSSIPPPPEIPVERKDVSGDYQPGRKDRGKDSGFHPDNRSLPKSWCLDCLDRTPT